MRTAAALYAGKGFLGTSMSEIAAACKTSKSLIYHYYPSKEDILFEVMDSHVRTLVEEVTEIAGSTAPPAERIHGIARTLMSLYEGAEAQQKVLLNDVPNLPPASRAAVIEHQKQLLNIIDGVLIEYKPALWRDKPRRRVLTMLFFGMLNWTHTWFDPSGAVSARSIGDMAAKMLLSAADDEA